jgi:hypothetical protein
MKLTPQKGSDVRQGRGRSDQRHDRDLGRIGHPETLDALAKALLEYIRLGIPIITTAVGGIVDPQGVGLRFPVEADGERVAEVLAGGSSRAPAICDDEKDSGSRQRVCCWDRTANEMLSLLDGSTPDM